MDILYPWSSLVPGTIKKWQSLKCLLKFEWQLSKMVAVSSLDLRVAERMIDSGPHSVTTVRNLATSGRDAQIEIVPQCAFFVLVPMYRLTAKTDLTLSVLTAPPLIPHQRDVSILHQVWIAV